MKDIMNNEEYLEYKDFKILKSEYEIVKKSSAFDVEWYLCTYKDIKKVGIDPIIHYILYGAKEGRLPSKNFNVKHFDTDYSGNWCNPVLFYEQFMIDYNLVKLSKFFNSHAYLENNLDVKKAGIDPIYHYLRFGWREGRNTTVINGRQYLFEHDDLVKKNINPIYYFEYLKVEDDCKVIELSNLFDKNYYISTYKIPENVDPIKHFLTEGYLLGYQPNSSFDGQEYYLNHGMKNNAFLEYCKEQMLSRKKVETKDYDLTVLFKFQGGIGDLLIVANYLHYFIEKFTIENKSLGISLYAIPGVEQWFNFIFSSFEKINMVTDPNFDKLTNNYDLVIDVSRIPKIRKFNKKQVFMYSNDLSNYALSIVNYWELYKKFDLRDPWFDGQLAKFGELQGKKRYNSYDFNNVFNVDPFFTVKPKINFNKEEYLEKIGLNGKRFITIQRGCDVRNEGVSTKLWPLSYYNILVPMIKRKYPNIIIVELGASEKFNPKFTGVDIYLAGKTSLEQLAILLENSFLHIDGEGGMVHLRHTMCQGKSIVLFGPTSDKYFGYEENINLRSKFCNECCEWMNASWQKNCTSSYRKNMCMCSITPDLVLSEVDKVFAEI